MGQAHGLIWASAHMGQGPWAHMGQGGARASRAGPSPAGPDATQWVREGFPPKNSIP